MDNQDSSKMDKRAVGLAGSAAKHTINVIGENNTNTQGSNGGNQSELIRLFLALSGLAIYLGLFV